MRNLTCDNLQLDEVWDSLARSSAIYLLTTIPPRATFGRSAPFMPRQACSRVQVGKRDAETANAFVSDLADD